MIFGLVWSLFLAPLIIKLLKKYNIDITNEQLNMIKQLIEAGIAYAEEQAHNREKSDPANRLTQNQKLDLAINYIRQNDNQNLLKNIDSKQLAGMIQSTLNRIR